MSSATAKRAFDLIAAGLGSALLAPVMAAAAIAVRLDSPGPILFRQTRVGYLGQPFEIRKFRTMRHAIEGKAITIGADPRITRTGRFLRRSKIDELPQLLDVVQGRMSLVGPRPELPEYAALWPSDARRIILGIRPGITDPASIEFRDESALLASQPDPDIYYREVILPRKVDLYVRYARQRTLFSDILLILRTLGAIAK